ARIAFGGVTRTLLMPHQDVLDIALLENLVIDRKHRAAGIAKEVFHAVIDERADDHRGAGHLVWIVAFVTHGLCPGRAVGSGLFLGLLLLRKIKKGPRRPHAHRPDWDGRQPSPAVRLGTTMIRSLVIILRI